MNSTIRTPDDIHKHLGLSILGQIPLYNAMEKVKNQRQSDKSMWKTIKEKFSKHKRCYKDENDDSIRFISLTDSNSPVAEAYRTIRTNIQFENVRGGNGNALKTIIITSSVRNSGKSTTIANLALVMAQAGSKVLLVDCNLRNPTLHKFFKMSKVGLSDIVATGAAPADCITQCEYNENLYLLPAGSVPPNPSELLCSHRVEELIGYTRDYYDYVLLDMPPILPVTDAAVMSSKVDGVIMCVACNSTHPSMERQAEDLLRQAGAKIIGVIINKVDVASSTYYGKCYGHYNCGYYYDYYGEENGKRRRCNRHHKEHRFAWIKKLLRSLTRWSD